MRDCFIVSRNASPGQRRWECLNMRMLADPILGWEGGMRSVINFNTGGGNYWTVLCIVFSFLEKLCYVGRRGSFLSAVYIFFFGVSCNFYFSHCFISWFLFCVARACFFFLVLLSTSSFLSFFCLCLLLSFSSVFFFFLLVLRGVVSSFLDFVW